MKLIIFHLLLLLTFAITVVIKAQSTFLKVFEQAGDRTTGSNIIEAPDGGFYISGYEKKAEHGDSSTFFILKCDSNGIYKWKKKFNTDDLFLRRYAPLLRTSDDNILAVITAKNSSHDIAVLKLDSFCNLISEQIVQTNGREEYALEIKQTYDDGFCILGLIPAANNSWKTLIYKTDKDLNVIWEKIIVYYPRSLDIFADNSLLCVTQNDVFKISSDGDIEWEKHFNESELSACTCNDGNILVASDRTLSMYDKNGLLLSKVYSAYYLNRLFKSEEGGYIAFSESNRLIKYGSDLQNKWDITVPGLISSFIEKGSNVFITGHKVKFS